MEMIKVIPVECFLRVPSLLITEPYPTASFVFSMVFVEVKCYILKKKVIINKPVGFMLQF